MRVIDVSVYQGPHRYSSTPMVRIRVDLGELEALPTDRIPGFAEQLVRTLPGLGEHRCSLGRPGGFLDRMRDGTWLGHVVEHVALELESMVGGAATRGKTRSVAGSPGVYDILFAYDDREVGVAAGALALRLVHDLLPEPHRALELGRLPAPPEAEAGGPVPGLSALRRLAEARRLGPTTRSLVDAAQRRGIPARRADDASLVRLGYGANQRLIRASITDRTSQLAVDLAGDKQRTRDTLAAAGIPVPRGTKVRTVEEAVTAAKRLGGPVVTKPLDGNHGRGVRTRLVSEEEIRAGFEEARRHSRTVIVEQHVTGRDHRVLVVGGRVVAVAERVPAHVIGNGTHTIEQLVGIVNAHPDRGAGHSGLLTRLELDDAADRVLTEQGLARDAVPEVGRIVTLRDTANLSTGGEAIDRTDDVSAVNLALLERAAEIIGLDVTGIDVIAPELVTPLTESGGVIIEVNAAPGFRMHLAPSSGQARDVAGPVIDSLFPDASAARIPLVAVTGTNGKSTTTRMLAHILAWDGTRVGMTTTSGIYVDGHLIEALDASGPRSAMRVLDDPTVEAAVLETARGGLLREGLAVGELDVGIVLNVTADHLGLGDIRTLEELADVKSIVVREVRPSGVSVLNADDPLADRLRAVASGRLASFTLGPMTERLDARREAGEIVAVLEPGPDGGTLLIHDEHRTIRLLSSAEIPATLGGAAGFNVQNALAAATGAYALGVPAATIAQALSDFDCSYEQNPGRLNLTRVTGFTTIVDYAHNPAALQALGVTIEAIRPTAGRVIGVVSTPGDRRDEDIRELGRLGALIFDELVLRERPDGRGRGPGEVVRLLREGAASTGKRAGQIHIVPGEREAMELALSMASRHDLVVLMPTSVEAVWQQVHDFAARRQVAASRVRITPPGGSPAGDERAPTGTEAISA